MSEMGAIRTGERRRSKGPAPWPGLLLSLAVAAALATALVIWRGLTLPLDSHAIQGSQIATVLGLAVLSAAVGWLAGWYAFVRRSGAKVAAPYFVAALIAALLAAGAAGVWRGLPSSDAKLVASAQALAAQSRKTLSDDTYAFNGEYAPLQWWALLSPAGLANDSSLANVKGKLTAMHALVARYRAKGLSRETAVRARLAGLGATPQARAQAQAAYDTALGGTIALEAAYWAMQDKALADGDWIVAMLSRTRGDWKAAGVSVIFRGRGDLAGYQSHLAAIQKETFDMNPIAQKLANPDAPIPATK
jgi:hypothetical protein